LPPTGKRPNNEVVSPSMLLPVRDVMLPHASAVPGTIIVRADRLPILARRSPPVGCDHSRAECRCVTCPSLFTVLANTLSALVTFLLYTLLVGLARRWSVSTFFILYAVVGAVASYRQAGAQQGTRLWWHGRVSRVKRVHVHMYTCTHASIRYSSPSHCVSMLSEESKRVETVCVGLAGGGHGGHMRDRRTLPRTSGGGQVLQLDRGCSARVRRTNYKSDRERGSTKNTPYTTIYITESGGKCFSFLSKGTTLQQTGTSYFSSVELIADVDLQLLLVCL
jgi:hypothetical protein